MKRAVILGYQGFGNAGDEAILTGIERLLDDVSIEVEAIVGGTEPIAAFPQARRIAARRLRPNVAGLRALMRADLLLMSGGGLIHDHWISGLPLYLAWNVAARLAGAQIIWIGVGIGPLRSRWSRFLAGRILRLAALVTVRDAESARLALDVAPHVTATITPDPAFFNPAPPERTRSGVGAVIRAPAPQDSVLESRFATALGNELSAIAASGRDVVLLTMGGARDTRFAEAVRRAALSAGTNARVEQLRPDPMTVLHRLGSLEAIITVRLHGLILGAIAGTPALPIAYDPKVSAVAAQLGLDDLSLTLEQVVSSPVGTLAGLLGLAETPERRNRVADEVAGLRAQQKVIRSSLESHTA